METKKTGSTTNQNVLISDISLNKTNLRLNKGSSEILKEILPENASNKMLTWTSTNPEAVSVDENGKVQALKEGKTTITVETHDGKRQKGVKGYEISYSADKKFDKKQTKIRYTEKTSDTIPKLKKNKTYYVRVRAYKIDSAKKKVYGGYSKTLRVKIKK